MEERTKSKHPLLDRKWKNRLCWKAQKSREASPSTRAKIPCLWGANCKRSSRDYRHPPVCRNYKSGNGCIHGQRCHYRRADGKEKPSKRSKKDCTQGEQLPFWERIVQGCVSPNSDPKKSIPRKAWELRLERFGGTHHKILRTHLVRNSNSGHKRAI